MLSMEKFLALLKKDEELLENFKSQTTSEGLYSIAKPYIGDMTQEEFINNMEPIFIAADKIQQGQELDDTELENVAGGMAISTALFLGSAAFSGVGSLIKAIRNRKKR